MATDTYSEGGSTYYRAHRDEPRRDERTAVGGYHDPAGMAFLWVGWTLAFTFWAFSMTTFVGIMRAIWADGPDSLRAGVSMVSGPFLLMEGILIAVVVGAAIAWGMARRMTRDTRRDQITEAATAELYDTAGDDEDVVGRSHGARHPMNRGSNRPR